MPTPESSRRPVGDRAHNDQRPTAEKACTECRRRKSKCNRVIPSCYLCRKFGRSCVYEAQKKMPLTRRYLTQVEDELAETKALLDRFMTQSHDTSVSRPEHTMSSPENSPGPQYAQGCFQILHEACQSENAERITAPESRAQQRAASRLSGAENLSRYLAFETPTRRDETRSEIPSHSRSSGTLGSSLETPPLSSNFDWDERSGKTTGAKFVDGMASLTSASSEGGYLGMASGAALLRATDARPIDVDDSRGSDPHSGQENCYASSIPFSLTSLSHLEPFIDAYFSLYHLSYPIVHEATFRAQFMEVIPRPSGNAWQVLLFVLAAVGAFTSSTQPTDVDIGLFDAAKARLSIELLETGNLLLVQVLTLMSNYLQKRNKPNSGYNYMGLARRIAMGIGLHKELPPRETGILKAEMRRRVWYSLYIFDVGAIITFSRPLDFPDNGIDVELPLNVHDCDITFGTRELPNPSEETTVYTHLRCQATFHMATGQIYSRIISRPFPSASELLEFDDRLIGHWLTSLPPFFQDNVRQAPKYRLCHSVLRWRYRNFRILMYRPFLVGRLIERPGGSKVGIQGSDLHADIAIQRCLDAARESVEQILKFWMEEQRSMMACWYGLYFLFQATLIPVICLRNDPQCSYAVSWRDQILQAICVLESMAPINPTALRCLGVIRSLCGEYLDTSADGWAHPTEETIQTQLASLYPLMWPALDMTQLNEADSIWQEATIMDFMNQLPGAE